VECLFIGGGFSALLTAARLRERGVESIRIVERAPTSAAPGTGTAIRARPATCRPTTTCPCWTRWDYVPSRLYAKGPEIYAHCQAIARRYDLYDLAVFRTTVISTVWDEAERLWRIGTDRGDTMKARFRDLRQRHALEA